MQSTKSALGWIGALVPLAYCVGLIVYFQSVGGSFEGAIALGLGPTMLGLGGVGLLFCLPLVMKLIKLATGPKTRAAAAEAEEAEAPFDPDAALARYMAKKAAGEVEAPVYSEQPEIRPVFGRKVA
jgi:hypothetical protein